MFARNRLKSLLTVVTLALVGCGSAPVQIVNDTYQALVYKSRTKGEREIAAAAPVRRELDCSDKKPFELRLEHSELVPARLKSGREINHRFIYAACLPRDTAQTQILVRRISRGGKVMFEDRSAGFVVKPGRWVVDTFIGIPPAAPVGGYELETFFELRTGAGRQLRTDFELTN